ncbi:hypothetical protein CCACVL1_05014 [Corchorus capsularis]|uniref:Uncharacterized protein n=1 Tax=Corchorus capsularis TaxID=210143 RepID=A0A1R3JN28_COCAP|nr:hypothetical protein CCACVL1_05014 [Corchorus capsularis]
MSLHFACSGRAVPSLDSPDFD